MNKIEKFIHMINEELDGANFYAEKYITYMYLKPAWGKMYREMSEQELNHAEYLYRMCTEYANSISWISEETRVKWEECIEHYAFRTGVVKAMLNV